LQYKMNRLLMFGLTCTAFLFNREYEL